MLGIIFNQILILLLTGIGGGWQLAYKKAQDGKGDLQRVYLHQEPGMGSARGSMRGSVLSLHPSDVPEGQLVQAAGLVSQSTLNIKDFKGESPLEGGNIQPSSDATKGPSWRELFEPGVKSALLVGVGIQILQQVNRKRDRLLFNFLTILLLKIFIF